MKHLINILVLLILVGLCVGVAYMIKTDTPNKNFTASLWGIAYLPLTAMIIAWGIRLNKQY